MSEKTIILKLPIAEMKLVSEIIEAEKIKYEKRLGDIGDDRDDALSMLPVIEYIEQEIDGAIEKPERAIILTEEHYKRLRDCLVAIGLGGEIDDRDKRITFGSEVFEVKKPEPVDRSNLCTIHGADPSEVRTKQKEEGNVGQHSDYLILCDEERAKGFVRPVRNAYIHVGANPEMQGCVLLKKPTDACGSRTQMGKSLAETYARDPSFYGATFCCSCNAHFPVEQFMWEGTTERLGS